MPISAQETLITHGPDFGEHATIASWIGSPEFQSAEQVDNRISEMHFWTLEKQENNTATLFAKADSPEDAFITQEIEFTDFLLPRIDIWAAYDGHFWTLYLPSEH